MEGGWKEYFVFSRKERFAIFFLLIIIMLLVYMPYVIHPPGDPGESIVWLPIDSVLLDDRKESRKSSHAADPAPGNELWKDSPGNYQGKPIADANAHRYELFFFDPNTASTETLKKLGIKERQVTTIQRYISKGGRFRKAEDLERVYGMSEDEVKRLKPYVRIIPANRPSLKNIDPDMQYQQPLTNTRGASGKGMRTRDYQEKNEPYVTKNVPLEINSASKQDWERLPGIGATLATRIVTFREKLGGFYSVLQVAETYGLPDSTYRKIMSMLTCDTTACRKLAINQVTEEELNVHPYFRGATATALIRYRKEHGDFKEPADMKKIKSIDAQVYSRILPYTTVKHP